MVTNYFEWMGAGFYSPLQQSAAMHGPAAILRELYYGRDLETIYLRIDFHEHATDELDKLKLRIIFRNTGARAVVITFSQILPDEPVRSEMLWDDNTPNPDGEAALGRIFEMRAHLAAIGVGPDESCDFQATIWKEGLPRETFPLEGWLSVAPPP